MAPKFHPRHIPALFAATTMTFGGIWPIFHARGSMRAYGFPRRIAESPLTAPVMIAGTVRTTVIGMLMYIFYSRNQLAVVDTILALTGGYAGIIDSYVVWSTGSPGKAVFRFVSSWLLGAWGLAGMTAGH